MTKQYKHAPREEGVFYRHPWGVNADEQIGVLRLTCPKCRWARLRYWGGNLMSRPMPVPGHEGAFWINGGPLHLYECPECGEQTNWKDIPEECWEVLLCAPKPRYHGPWQEPFMAEMVVLHGPRQRPVG